MGYECLFSVFTAFMVLRFAASCDQLADFVDAQLQLFPIDSGEAPAIACELQGAPFPQAP